MDQFKIRLSLRYKLLLILITLPLSSLGLYLLMATDLFKEDKVAYVYDSSATVSRSLATQTRMETQSAYTVLRAIIEQYDFQANDFTQAGREFFGKNPKVHAVLLFRRTALGSI
ncbi:MAG: hypothetical protein HC902_06905 [Calothrix sp. SM1_5_4]|nr:hypothetical protein [Calothrix sp. SM1_5_4]